MKRIIFVRHAKTEAWDYGKEDFHRQLTDRGVNDCAIMATSLEQNQLTPSIIFTSSAARALRTADILANRLHLPEEQISSSKELYEYVSTQHILDLVHQCDDAMDTIMIVGHNPWISNVASVMSNNFQSIMPTAGVVALEYKIEEWHQINPNKGKIIYYETPKAFK